MSKTFQMCVQNDRERVSIEELVQLLEAVAELKGDDPSSASLIAKTIMKLDKRQDGEKIKKEEFVSQCVISKKVIHFRISTDMSTLLVSKEIMTCVWHSYQWKLVSSLTHQKNIKKEILLAV